MTTSTTQEQQLQEQIQQYMQQDLKNQMIEWKKQQSQCDKAEQFERFLFEQFPENIEAELRISQALSLSDDSDSESDYSDSDILEENVCNRFSAHTVKWVDTRVQGEEWRDAFVKVRPEDTVVPLGAPPGMDYGVQDQSCSDCMRDNVPQLWNSDRFSSFSSVKDANVQTTASIEDAMQTDLKEMGQQISSFFQKTSNAWSTLATSLDRLESDLVRTSSSSALPIGLMEAC